MNTKLKVFLILISISLKNCLLLSAQSVSFELSTNPSIDFTFNTITKYQNGIVIPSAVKLNVLAIGTQWDMYVGTTTATAGIWENIQYYSTTGDGFPSVGLLQIAFRNISSTSQITGYVPLEDIATTSLNVIGDRNFSPDVAVNCSDVVNQGTNTPGSYLTDPQCYQFKVDFKIVPGMTYRAGVYTLRVDIIIAQDL